MGRYAIVFTDTDIEADEFSLEYEGDFDPEADDRSMAEHMSLICMAKVTEFIELLQSAGGLFESDGDDDELEDE